ncbi:MAG: CBS domain-containing protein [Peptococcaceae bacterium]|nr:CBS domain-containing protein [Peptococcaceae bacterium]
MISEKRVRDIMGPSLLVEVSPETSVKELVAAFMQAIREGKDPTVLIKERNNVVGMLNRNDLLDILDPPYTKGDIKMEIFWEGLFTDQWRAVAERKVKDLMRSPVVVDPDDTLMKVSHIFNDRKVSTVLVVDQGQLVGTVSVDNLFNELVNDRFEAVTQ